MYKRLNLLKMIVVILIIFSLVFINYSTTKASTTIEPEANQYFELKAITITEVDGQNRQVIMELWGHDIDFKRI